MDEESKRRRPMFDKIQHDMDSAMVWFNDARAFFDPDFTDPTIAQLARMRALLLRTISEVDKFIEADAQEVSNIFRDTAGTRSVAP
jgi:hypothetical protein